MVHRHASTDNAPAPHAVAGPWFGPRYRLDTTADGSPTVWDAQAGAHYHSADGALGESWWVYMQGSGLVDGFNQAALAGRSGPGGPGPSRPWRVLEIGLGTGLNAWLVAQAAALANQPVEYQAWEPNPLPAELLRAYYAQLKTPAHAQPWVEALATGAPTWAWQQARFIRHPAPWPAFASPTPPGWADAVFYDAFGPKTDPEAWDPHAAKAALDALAPGGRLVTFSVTGFFKRMALAAGLAVHTPKGFGRKREMLVVQQGA